MSTSECIERDERTVSVENASYRWAYLLLVYALLVDVAIRGLVLHEAAWDLLALLNVAGAICIMYQAHHRILARRWLALAVLAPIIGAIVAILFALLG